MPSANLKKAKEMLAAGQISKVGDTLWEIGYGEDSQIVRLVVKPGREFMTCSCQNESMHSSQNPFCSHKYCVILFEGTNKFQTKVKKLIKDYEAYKEINMQIDPESIIQDLKDFRGI